MSDADLTFNYMFLSAVSFALGTLVMYLICLFSRWNREREEWAREEERRWEDVDDFS